LKTAKRSTQGSEQKEKLGCTVPLSTLAISASANPGSGARIRGFSIQRMLARELPSNRAIDLTPAGARRSGHAR